MTDNEDWDTIELSDTSVKVGNDRTEAEGVKVGIDRTEADGVKVGIDRTEAEGVKVGIDRTEAEGVKVEKSISETIEYITLKMELESLKLVVRECQSSIRTLRDEIKDIRIMTERDRNKLIRSRIPFNFIPDHSHYLDL